MEFSKTIIYVRCSLIHAFIQYLRSKQAMFLPSFFLLFCNFQKSERLTCILICYTHSTHTTQITIIVETKNNNINHKNTKKYYSNQNSSNNIHITLQRQTKQGYDALFSKFPSFSDWKSEAGLYFHKIEQNSTTAKKQ